MVFTKVREWVENLADKCFRMPELVQQAQDLGVETDGLDKTELIQAIQQAQGNTPCFAATEEQCDQDECTFKTECDKTAS